MPVHVGRDAISACVGADMEALPIQAECGCGLLDGCHHRREQIPIHGFGSKDGFDVGFGDNDNVNFGSRFGVVKGEHALIFPDFFNV